MALEPEGPGRTEVLPVEVNSTGEGRMPSRRAGTPPCESTQVKMLVTDPSGHYITFYWRRA